MDGKRHSRADQCVARWIAAVAVATSVGCGSARVAPAASDAVGAAVEAGVDAGLAAGDVEPAPIDPAVIEAAVDAARTRSAEAVPGAFEAADAAVDRWGLVMTTCPTDRIGSLAGAWTWASPHDEDVLLGLDLHGDGTTFDLLADYEGTSIIIRVRDAATGDARAVIKTNSSNTRVTAEIYAYRLSVFLGFEHLVPPTSPIAVDGGALQKMRDLLADTSYADDYKERARQVVVRDLDAAIAAGGAYEGALKPWLGAFMFTQALGERDRLVNHPVMDYLVASGPQPDGTEVELVQITRLYSPAGTHRGRLTMADLAEDLSNLMLMDALMGQNDRFAGANLHFQSVAGGREEVGERNGRPVFDLGAVRLLALDNGAALRGRHGTGLNDLNGAILSGTRVERFEPETIERLRALGRRALGYGCERAPFDDEVDAIWTYLGIDDADRRERASALLGDVLEHLDDLEARHGDTMRLQPPPPEPVVDPADLEAADEVASEAGAAGENGSAVGESAASGEGGE